MSLLDFLHKKEPSTGNDLSTILPQDIYAQGKLNLLDTLAPTALKIGSREIEIDEKFVRTFYTISYPAFLSDGWFAPIINLDKVLDVSIFVHPIDTEKALHDFQKKVADVQSQINEREHKGLVRDPKLDAAYQNLESLRDRLQQAQEKLFDVGLYIAIYGNSKKELDKIEGEVRGILDAQLIYTKPALFQQEQGFRTVLPLENDELMVESKLNSEPLSSIFPFTSFDLTSDSGILYGINRHNSSLILFDRFSLENYNSVVFAKSGSGKSYGTKLEILRSLMFGTDVIVIDPEREYEQLTEATDGRSFDISLSSEHHINPFDLPAVQEDENPKDILRNNIITLVGMFRIMLSGLTPEEDSIIDRTIAETYALKDITGETDFSNISPPLLSDFETVLMGMEGSDSLVRKISFGF